MKQVKWTCIIGYRNIAEKCWRKKNGTLVRRKLLGFTLLGFEKKKNICFYSICLGNPPWKRTGEVEVAFMLPNTPPTTLQSPPPPPIYSLSSP